jgi:plastocyanin
MSNTMVPRRNLLVGLLMCAAALAACGGSGASPAGSTAASAAAPSGTAPSQAPAAGGDASVTIQDFAFGPPSLSVAAGTTVTWTNADGAAHTATADDGSFDSGPLAQGQTFSHTFDTAGTFTYICTIHPTMKGTITVQ